MNIIRNPSPTLPSGLFLCYDQTDGSKNQAGALLRKLAGQAGLDGRSLSLLKEESGKPYGLIDSRAIGVSVTHTKEIICCGLYLHGQIGVDIEAKNRKVADGLRQRITHENETSLIADMSTLRLWTIKESVLKMTGSGLRTAMKKVEIHEIQNTYFKVVVNSVECSVISLEHNGYWLSVAFAPTNPKM